MAYVQINVTVFNKALEASEAVCIPSIGWRVIDGNRRCMVNNFQQKFLSR